MCISITFYPSPLSTAPCGEICDQKYKQHGELVQCAGRPGMPGLSKANNVCFCVASTLRAQCVNKRVSRWFGSFRYTAETFSQREINWWFADRIGTLLSLKANTVF